MDFELIAGNCEECGVEYSFSADLSKLIYCPSCKSATANWDTVEYPQMAPAMIMIKK